MRLIGGSFVIDRGLCRLNTSLMYQISNAEFSLEALTQVNRRIIIEVFRIQKDVQYYEQRL